MSAALHILGIRHHGPGSARSVQRALDQLEPDAVLIEGPPDAQNVIELAAHEQMSPPVAILVYQADSPRNAVLYPFAEFSPEWVAIRWALARQNAPRFIDLALVHRFALPPVSIANLETPKEPELPPPAPDDVATVALRTDPLDQLARLAGFDDGERWWEHLVEARPDGPIELFDEIRQAMAELRRDRPIDPLDALREAQMRQSIREARKQGHQNIAVVCGAYHAPVLDDDTLAATRSSDASQLKGLAKIKTVATWVPWTHDRLTFASGYGAGVNAPGWYHHLWSCPRNQIEHWMTRVARLMREKDFDCSSASVIEAVRLSHTLAGLRDRPMPDLSDLADATQSVFCFDAELPMNWIHRDLMIGHCLGRVPNETAMIPLQQDLLAQQKRLRLKPEALERTLDLDLRSETDLQRSHLLHRLRLLGLPWGEPSAGSSGKGTFREGWRLRWQVEFVVQVVEKSALGNTVESAAGAYVADRAAHCDHLADLTTFVDDVMLAGLPQAVEALMQRVATVGAVAADVSTLMRALPPLARVLRYGNVRQTDTDMVRQVIDGLTPRIIAGLGGACGSLNDEAAAEMSSLIAVVDDAIALRSSEEQQQDWMHCLTRIAGQDAVHGIVRGRCARILFDSDTFTTDDVALHLGLALSRGSDPKHGADWLGGFLQGSGLLLIHDARLLSVIDDWVTHISADTFDSLLPLLRRTFSSFPPAERQQIGRQLADGKPTSRSRPNAGDAAIDPVRAARVLPYLKTLLGVSS